jgi:hypothetical protein
MTFNFQLTAEYATNILIFLCDCDVQGGTFFLGSCGRQSVSQAEELDKMEGGTCC